LAARRAQSCRVMPGEDQSLAHLGRANRWFGHYIVFRTILDQGSLAGHVSPQAAKQRGNRARTADRGASVLGPKAEESDVETPSTRRIRGHAIVASDNMQRGISNIAHAAALSNLTIETRWAKRSERVSGLTEDILAGLARANGGALAGR
jgi:hypothetical protein